MKRRDLESGQEVCDGRKLLCLDQPGGALRGERLRRGVWVELGGRGGGRSSLGTVGGESIYQFVLMIGQEETDI